MYDPETGRGFKGWPNAVETFHEHWDLALRHFKGGHAGQAFFCLGAAAHLVQDLCVPHHAAARLFAGHREFEGYARRYRHRYATHQGGLYGLASEPQAWVTANAHYTRERYSGCISETLSRLQIHTAVSDLLPRAQRSTAGFVAFFLQEMGVA